MKKVGILICFIWPLISSIFGVQLLVGEFGVLGKPELISYSNVLLVLIGIIIIRKDIKKPSKMASLWLFFYLLFYGFGLFSAGLSGFNAPISRTLLPLTFFIGFYFFISNNEYSLFFFKVFTVSLVASSFLTILFFKLNYDFDYHGFVPWPIDRAGGVYADANNAALVSVLAYFFLNLFFVPTKPKQKIIKYLLLFIIFYSLFITFSTTGLSTFIVLFLINNHKFFKGIKLIIFGLFGIMFYSSLFVAKSLTSQLNLSESQIQKINNLINVLTLNTEQVDSSGRAGLIDNFMINIYKNPIIGNGIDFSVVNRAHNTYLVILGDAGIITFAFFLFILVYYLIKSLHLKTHLRLFCFSIILILCIFMISLQTVINQPYLIVLFVFIGYLIDNQQSLLKKQTSLTT